MPDPAHSDPLAFAVHAFERWREQRPTPGARVPPPLRQIACRLLDVEPRVHVARALQIPQSTLGRWQARDDGQRRPATRAAAVPSSAFVPLPSAHEHTAVSTPANTPAPLPSLVIERPDGVRLHLGGPIDIATVTALVAPGASR